MALSNDKEKVWTGWLVDGAGGKETAVHEALRGALVGRNIPKSEVTVGRLNMWWRKDSLFIDVKSSMDGVIQATIHVQEYGTSLWVGRAAESYRQTNYYKRMAAAAFLETVDRCILETIQSVSGEKAVRVVLDVAAPPPPS